MDGMSTLPITNHLLSCLSQHQHQWFLANSKPVKLVFGEVLGAAGDSIEYVYFPVTGFISLLVAVVDAPSIEMGLIGSEGMLGATLALGNNHAPMQSLVQGAGTALRMDALLFRQRLESSSTLRQLIHSYLYVLLVQLAQTGACNCFHEVQQRLARWLLMSHDRAHSKHFRLTHDFLATMLGVRRSAVTIAAGALQHKGLISYRRGQINILSREGLENTSCGCYDTAIDTYQKNIKQQI